MTVAFLYPISCPFPPTFALPQLHYLHYIIVIYLLFSNFSLPDPPHLAFRCRIANQSDDSIAIHCLPDIRVNYTSEEEETRQADEEYSSQGIFVYPTSYFKCQVYRKNEPYPIINASYPLKVPYKSHSYGK